MKTKRKSNLKSKRSAPQIGDQACPVTFVDATKVHPALKPLMGYCLNKVTTLLRARIMEALKPLQIHVHHMAILVILNAGKPVSQNQMCEELGIDKASMVKLVDHLEKLKALQRNSCSDDRRVKYLELTNKGSELLKKAMTLRTEAEKAFLSKITKAEESAFRAVLIKLVEA